MDEHNYLRKLGVFKCTIKSGALKDGGDYKGKPYPAALVLTLETDDGLLIDEKIKKFPDAEKAEWEKKRLGKLCKAAGVEKASELPGKVVAVLVEPYEPGNGVSTKWNPRNYYDVKYLLSPQEKLEKALDDTSSDFGF